MKCPRCRKPMARHVKDKSTFVEEGNICVRCGYIQTELNAVQTQTGVIIKGWKKADDSDLERRLREWELRRDD